MAVAPDAADLAAAMRSGDARAFEAWVRHTHELVFRVCRRLVDAADAEDAVQETYVRAWRTAAKLRDPAAHRGWICQIARYVCADRARGKAARDVPILDDETAAAGIRALASTEPLADEVLASVQVRAVVADAIAKLSAKHRIVLLLREVDELEYEEIAEALAIPRGTVESRLHRARAELAKALERHRKAAERRHA